MRVPCPVLQQTTGRERTRHQNRKQSLKLLLDVREEEQPSAATGVSLTEAKLAHPRLVGGSNQHKQQQSPEQSRQSQHGHNNSATKALAKKSLEEQAPPDLVSECARSKCDTRTKMLELLNLGFRSRNAGFVVGRCVRDQGQRICALQKIPWTADLFACFSNRSITGRQGARIPIPFVVQGSGREGGGVTARWVLASVCVVGH